MSGRFTTIGLFFSLVAIALAANFAADEAPNNPPMSLTRQPASVASLSKEEILGEFNAGPILKHTEKLRGPLSVRLEVVGGRPANVGETFVMRGIIASRQPLDVASYAWSIPQGIEVVNGTLTGSLSTVGPEQPGIVELTLRKTVAENVQVHLMASSTRAGQRFGDATHFDTDTQEMLNKGQQKMRAMTESTIRKQQKLKIFH